VPNDLYSFAKRKGGDSKYDRFNKNRYSYDVNTLSGLDNWRSKDTSSSNNRGPGEFKSMKNFDEPSKQIQRTVSYKSEKSIPAKIVRNFAKDKLYHPSVTFECNDVEITVKMYDVYKTRSQAIVVPCLLNDSNHKLTTRMTKLLGANIHEQAKTAKLGTIK